MCRWRITLCSLFSPPPLRMTSTLSSSPISMNLFPRTLRGIPRNAPSSSVAERSVASSTSPRRSFSCRGIYHFPLSLFFSFHKCISRNEVSYEARKRGVQGPFGMNLCLHVPFFTTCDNSGVLSLLPLLPPLFSSSLPPLLCLSHPFNIIVCV